MKRIGTVLSVLLLCSLAGAPLASPAPVRICYEYHAQPPYIFGEHDVPTQHAGLLVELITQAVIASGLDVAFYRASWNRCLQDLKDGDADSTFAMIWTDDRDRWARFPKQTDGQLRTHARLWRGNYRVFTAIDHPLTWDGQQFSGLQFGLGAPLGYVAYQRLQAMDVLHPMALEPRWGLRLVAKGRMDGYVVDEYIGRWWLHQEQITEQMKILPASFFRDDWYLPFSLRFYDQNPEQAERIWSELARIREQLGDVLARRYLLDPGR